MKERSEEEGLVQKLISNEEIYSAYNEFFSGLDRHSFGVGVSWAISRYEE